MKTKIFKSPTKQSTEKYKYISAPFLDLYHPYKKMLIKNYVLDPDIKFLNT